jgi:hypothetical protein
MPSTLFGPAAVITLLLGAAQITTQSPTVSMSYEVKRVLTLFEPVVLKLFIDNPRDTQLAVDLGRNFFGNLQLSLRKPDGRVVPADPSRPKRLEDSHEGRHLLIDAGGQYSRRHTLDEWFDFEQVGDYELTVMFTGSVHPGTGFDLGRQGASGFRSLTWNEWQNVQRSHAAAIDIPTMSLRFRILPHNDAVLRGNCETLIQEAYSHDWREAVSAANILAYMKGPTAAENLARLLDPQKPPYVSSVEFIAIEGLARAGTEQARLALLEATSHPNRGVASFAQNRLERFVLR